MQPLVPAHDPHGHAVYHHARTQQALRPPCCPERGACVQPGSEPQIPAHSDIQCMHLTFLTTTPDAQTHETKMLLRFGMDLAMLSFLSLHHHINILLPRSKSSTCGHEIGTCGRAWATFPGPCACRAGVSRQFCPYRSSAACGACCTAPLTGHPPSPPNKCCSYLRDREALCAGQPGYALRVGSDAART